MISTRSSLVDFDLILSVFVCTILWGRSINRFGHECSSFGWMVQRTDEMTDENALSGYIRNRGRMVLRGSLYLWEADKVKKQKSEGISFYL